MKKFKGKGIKFTLLYVVCILLLTACGSGSGSYDSVSGLNKEAAVEVSKEMKMEEAGVYEEERLETEIEMDEELSVENQDSGNKNKVALSNRKLIKNVSLSVETETYESLLSTVEEQIDQLGGYIEQLYADNNENNNHRNSTITARIPKDSLDDFVQYVDQSSNITERNEKVEDVTLQYVDTEGRKAMYLAEQKKLIELLNKAETIEDIIAIETRLSEVSYQIESMEAQLRTYDNLIDYSTVTLYIFEVERYTPQEEKGMMERVKLGFRESLYEIGQGTKNFTVGFLVNIPFILIWIAVISFIVLMIKMIRKRNNKKKRIRQQVRLEKQEQEEKKTEQKEIEQKEIEQKEIEVDMEEKNIEKQKAKKEEKNDQKL